MIDRDKAIAAAIQVLAPDGIAAWEWGHETTPTAEEVRAFAVEIVDAILAPQVSACVHHWLVTQVGEKVESSTCRSCGKTQPGLTMVREETCAWPTRTLVTQGNI